MSMQSTSNSRKPRKEDNPTVAYLSTSSMSDNEDTWAQAGDSDGDWGEKLAQVFDEIGDEETDVSDEEGAPKRVVGEAAGLEGYGPGVKREGGDNFDSAYWREVRAEARKPLYSMGT